MRRAHAMPFGAQLRADGAVRFRLWAPDQPQVVLVLEAPARGEAAEAHPMEPRDGGWWELVTARTEPGTRYRFRLADGILRSAPRLAENGQLVRQRAGEAP